MGRMIGMGSSPRGGTFAALRQYPDFRLYWLGALASNIGYWIGLVAQGWVVYDLTGSPLYLGTVGFATAIPNLFLSLLGGVMADRFERRQLMIWTKSLSMALAFLLTFLTLSGTVAVWHILVIAFLSGVINAFYTPARQTIISDLVPKEHLLNAVALNSAQFQSSRTIGPALAGVIVALFGPGWCFFANGLSFLAVIWVLLVIKVPPMPPTKKASVAGNLMEGLRYVRGEPVILSLVLLSTVPSFFGMPYMQLMPAFASSVLEVGPHGLGLMLSSSGLGALLGALVVASLGKGARRGLLMLAAVVALGLGLAVFALSRSFSLSMVVLLAVGAAGMAFSALNQTFLQSMAADNMRGRVMSALTLATFGVQPLGTLAAGAVAEALGSPAAVLAGGIVCALFALWMLARRPALRRLT